MRDSYCWSFSKLDKVCLCVAIAVCMLVQLDCSVHAQTHRGQMDTDGVLSPGEIPNPRIDYGNGGYNNGDGRYGDDRYNNGRPSGNSGRCDQIASRTIGRPRVDIGRVKSTGGVFSDKVKVTGSVEGICLTEAGLFENGRKVQSIPINTEDRFGRYEFEVKAHMDKRPEIRVYATNGERDVQQVESE